MGILSKICPSPVWITRARRHFNIQARPIKQQNAVHLLGTSTRLPENIMVHRNTINIHKDTTCHPNDVSILSLSIVPQISTQNTYSTATSPSRIFIMFFKKNQSTDSHVSAQPSDSSTYPDQNPVVEDADMTNETHEAVRMKTNNSENVQYPSGLSLVLILSSLFISMFLVSLVGFADTPVLRMP